MTGPSLYELLRRSQQAILSNYALEARTALTIDRVRVLTDLAQFGSAIQIALVRRTGIDRSTLAVLLKAMASDGHITQRRGAKGDERAVVCTITKDGRKAMREARRGLQTAEREVFSRVARPEQTAVIVGLVALAGLSQ